MIANDGLSTSDTELYQSIGEMLLHPNTKINNFFFCKRMLHMVVRKLMRNETKQNSIRN